MTPNDALAQTTDVAVLTAVLGWLESLGDDDE